MTSAPTSVLNSNYAASLSRGIEVYALEPVQENIAHWRETLLLTRRGIFMPSPFPFTASTVNKITSLFIKDARVGNSHGKGTLSCNIPKIYAKADALFNNHSKHSKNRRSENAGTAINCVFSKVE